MLLLGEDAVTPKTAVNVVDTGEDGWLGLQSRFGTWFGMIRQ